MSKNIMYYDVATKKFNTAQHVGFNEAMNGVGKLYPTTAQFLHYVCTASNDAIVDIHLDADAPQLDVSSTPFLDHNSGHTAQSQPSSSSWA
jgi:hypothetical protein